MTAETADNAYTELGKFVEAFEMTVDALRNGCTLIYSSPAPKWQPLFRIPFHHRAMTAKPLIDIFAAILGTILNDADTTKALHLTDGDLRTFKGVLNQTVSDFEKLANKRNDLLHGTWYVGLNPEPLDLSKFVLSKQTTSNSGLKTIDSLPKDINQIKDLTDKCHNIRDCILFLYSTWGFGNNPAITTLLHYDIKEKRWIFTRKS